MGLSATVATNSLVSEIVGNVLFFVNCLATSLYVIVSKPLLRLYPALCVTAWGYMVASCMMLVVALALNSWPAAVNFLCPDCNGAL